MASEDELVERAVAGDATALQALLRDHASAACRAHGIDPRWRRHFDAEDLEQVTCMEAVERIGALRTPTLAGFRAWLSRMAANNLRDAVRGLESQKRAPASGRIAHESDERSERNLLARLGSDAKTASSLMRGREDVARLQQGLAELPPDYRAVVVGLDLEERSVADVAEHLGRSHGAVHMLRKRAHDRLRELLSEPGS